MQKSHQRVCGVYTHYTGSGCGGSLSLPQPYPGLLFLSGAKGSNGAQNRTGSQAQKHDQASGLFSKYTKQTVFTEDGISELHQQEQE